MKRIGTRLVKIFGMVVISTSLSYAQMNVGNIVGTITDPTGAVVPSAKLALVNQATQVTQETQTNASGFYTFKALPVGRYKLSVTLSGFQTYERPDIQVVSGETVTLDVKLVVGQETQTITVTGEAPLLDTATANSGTTRTEGEIEALPVADNSVDVIISNCVINLSPEKQRVFNEAFRVLKAGGRLAVADMVATAPLPDDIKADWAAYTGCIAGASQITELERMLQASGFKHIKIAAKDSSRSFIREWLPGRRIEDNLVSATIEAVKP